MIRESITLPAALMIATAATFLRLFSRVLTTFCDYLLGLETLRIQACFTKEVGNIWENIGDRRKVCYFDIRSPCSIPASRVFAIETELSNIYSASQATSYS